MKKIFGFILVFVGVLTLSACNGKRTYAADGKYTAFEEMYHEVTFGGEYTTAQLSWVTVTIEDDKIVKYEIDELQSTIVEGNLVWNEKTKKELGPDYGMLRASEIEKEWFEQAAAIEAKWLADGIDAVTYGDDGKAVDVADVSMIVNHHNRIAKAAVANAKAGKVIAFEEMYHDVTFGGEYTTAQVSWVEATIKDGKITSYYIDELQSTIVDGDVVWNEKTKKELGPDYGMLRASEIGKEWFEQAAAIEAKWLADGIDAVTHSEDGFAVDVTDVSMIVNHHNRIAKAAIAKVKL